MLPHVSAMPYLSQLPPMPQLPWLRARLISLSDPRVRLAGAEQQGAVAFRAHGALRRRIVGQVCNVCSLSELQCRTGLEPVPTHVNRI